MALFVRVRLPCQAYCAFGRRTPRAIYGRDTGPGRKKESQRIITFSQTRANPSWAASMEG